MSKVDLSDPLQGLTDLEKEYVDYLVNETKLNTEEINATFGDQYMSLSNDLKLRQISAKIKTNRKKRKNLIDQYKLEETTKAIPLALKTLVDIMKTGKEHNRLAAAQTLIRPSMAYLEKEGILIAESELKDGDVSSINDWPTKSYSREDL